MGGKGKVNIFFGSWSVILSIWRDVFERSIAQNLNSEDMHKSNKCKGRILDWNPGPQGKIKIFTYMLCQIWTFRVNIVPEIKKGATNYTRQNNRTLKKDDRLKQERHWLQPWTISGCQSHTWVTGWKQNGATEGKKTQAIMWQLIKGSHSIVYACNFRSIPGGDRIEAIFQRIKKFLCICQSNLM